MCGRGIRTCGPDAQRVEARIAVRALTGADAAGLPPTGRIG